MFRLLLELRLLVVLVLLYMCMQLELGSNYRYSRSFSTCVVQDIHGRPWYRLAHASLCWSTLNRAYTYVSRAGRGHECLHSPAAWPWFNMMVAGFLVGLAARVCGGAAVPLAEEALRHL